ncbi:MAG: Conjugal transfer protein TraG [Pelotomaculum sp. PtaB.Bin104]|nr:MAG: Conjugal transfer protein TraG [Pelotomaculum sp. PtaB.Bin104]
MKTKTKNVLIFCGIASLFVFYLFNRVALVFEGMPGNILERTNTAIDQIIPAISKEPFMIGTSKISLIAGFVGMAIIWLIFIYNFFGSKNFMRGIEHGSARWGTAKDIAPLTDKEPDMNIPLSATEQISVRKVKNFEADRNKNIVVVGGSGSGKTYSEIKPSLLQLHSSYVITDPKGTILPESGYLFTENGYELRSFNTIDFTKSLHYNPLSYIKKEKDILKVVTVLMENTNGEGTQSGEKFWKDCEKLLYTSFIAYLWYEAPPEDQNIPTMIEMLEMCKVKEDDEDYQSPIDIMFEDLEKEKPNCLAVKQYKKFKQAAGKTLKSILISCAARLAPFDIDELREITLYDELQLDEIGDRKTAFFVIMSDTDSTYSFLIAMIMYQMFNLLAEKADNEYNGTLPFQVRCLFDEFANIGKIPDFQHLISTIRSRGISCMIILQSLTQIMSIYKDDADTIIDCCDTFVFLGGKSTKTTKQVSEMIGKTTIDNQNINESRGQTGSYSIQNQNLGRDLIDAAEIGRLKRTECLVLISGLPPFKSKKYPTAKHRRFNYLSDGGKPLFDIREMREHSDEHFLDGVSAVQEVNLSELNALT